MAKAGMNNFLTQYFLLKLFLVIDVVAMTFILHFFSIEHLPLSISQYNSNINKINLNKITLNNISQYTVPFDKGFL